MDKDKGLRTVIITGANGNLGSTVTKHFLDKGYRVVATVRNESGKKELEPHQNLIVHIVDLADEEKTGLFIKDIIQNHGPVYAALMLAGGFAMGSLKETGSKDIRSMISLNFETAWHVARPLLEHMKEHNEGRLVFIGARPAIRPSDGRNMVAYALSKSLLFSMAEMINADTKGKNVTASVVVPSTIDTPPNRKSMPDADTSRWVKPEQLAEILEFICSDRGAVLRETVLKVYNKA